MAQGDHTRRRKANKRRPCTWPHMMIQEEKLVIGAEQQEADAPLEPRNRDEALEMLSAQDQALRRLDAIAEEYGMDD